MTGKHGKVEVKIMWWVLAQPPYSLQENRRQSPRVEITQIDHPLWKITQRTGIVKYWEDRQSLNIYVKQK